MNLVIVESPGKIKKIQSYLGNDYIVTASIGHIMDLDSKSISIDIENNFKPKYCINDDKKKVVKQLQEISKNKNIFIASDQDREGEFIAYSLKTILKLNSYSRIIFNEITKTAILTALNNSRNIDNNLVNAQQTRRILDRIVGYKLSPLITKHIGIPKLGTGRVQSVIVKLIVEKEKEINIEREKKRNKYYEGNGKFIINGNILKTELYEIKENIIKYRINEIENIKEQIIELLKLLKSSKWIIDEIKKKPLYINPTAPFTTSTLQQNASIKLHFPINKTMMIAQKLYESGYITYMRTDSTILSSQVHSDIKKYILDKYGNNYYSYKQYQSKITSQEAHEAIRPTNINIIDIDDIEQDKLYKLIWKKTISSQMKRSEYEITEIIIKAMKTKYLMIGNITRLIFDGYLKIYNDNELEFKEIIINENQDIELENIKIEQGYTLPIKHYNEATLVKCLENYEIGRPSTYASMIEKIKKQNFVKIDDIKGDDIIIEEYEYRKKDNKIIRNERIKKMEKEKNIFVPTELGINITNFLEKYFPQIMDYKFTANMEKELDEISNGNINWINVLTKFYNIFNTQIQEYLKLHPLNQNSLNNIIGTYNNNDIIFTNTKFGYAIKMFHNELNKDIWISVKNKPSLDEAIELFNNKNINDENIIKKIDKYIIKNGKYGPYIQTFINKKIKFFKIINLNPEHLTLSDCKKICKI
jgi:DNA topoisomerase-1